MNLLEQIIPTQRNLNMYHFLLAISKSSSYLEFTHQFWKLSAKVDIDHRTWCLLVTMLVRGCIQKKLELVSSILKIAPNDSDPIYPLWMAFKSAIRQKHIEWIDLLFISPKYIHAGTWNLVLKHYFAINRRQTAWDIYSKLKEKKLLVSKVNACFLSLISAANCDRRAFNVVYFDMSQFEHWDMHTNQTVMNALCRAKRFQKAVQLYLKFKDQKSLDLSIYTMLISKLTKYSFYIDAEMIINDFLESRMEWNEVAYHCVLDFYANSGNQEEFERTLAKFKQQFSPCSTTFGIMMTAVDRSNIAVSEKARKLEELYDQMIQLGIKSNQIIMNSLINYLGKSVLCINQGFSVKVDELITKHALDGILPDLTTFHTLIKNRIETGIQNCDDLILQMKKSGIEPIALTHSLILKCQGNNVKGAMQQYIFMKENRLFIGFQTMISFLESLVSARDWESFETVARHVMTNPRYRLQAEHIELVAKGYEQSYNPRAMNLLWYHIQYVKLKPTLQTFNTFLKTFRDTEFEHLIPEIWEACLAAHPQPGSLASLEMMKYWLSANERSKAIKLFKKLEIQETPTHEIFSLLLNSDSINDAYKWELFEKLKTHHIPTVEDFMCVFFHDDLNRLSDLWIEYQKYGYKATPTVAKALEPLQQLPELKKLIDLQLALHLIY